MNESRLAPIIVTGGAGFIGSNFVIDWIEHVGSPVINLDKLTYSGNMGNLVSLDDEPRHRFVRGDIGDRALVGQLMSEHQPRAIVNFAAESHVDRSIDSPGEFIETNISGTYQLLEAARAYWSSLSGAAAEQFRFLQVSTDEVYGSLGPDDAPFTEDHPYRPSSPYSASKAASDHLVRAYCHTYRLPTLITNCSNNYGPFQFPEKLIPLMIANARVGKPLPVYGDGSNVRDWLYVGDHCSAIRRVLDSGAPGSTYNIGGDSEKSNLEVVETLCGLLDQLLPESPYRPHASLIAFVKDRPGHDWRYAIDASRLKAELGWEPAETFADGMAKTVRWYLDNQDWVTNIDSYRGERLGLGK